VEKNLESLAAAYAGGADVNLQLSGGWTVLHIAARRADTRMAKMLIEWGAKLDAKTVNGTTALHIAANFGYYSFTWLLLHHGAHAEPADNQWFTPLHFAAYGNRREEYDLAVLRADGLTFAESELSGDVPTLGKNARLPAGISPNYNGVAELLLDSGASPSPITVYYETPLHYVSTYDQYRICQTLIMHGADIDYKDVQKETPLHEAVAYGAIGVTEELLWHGANSYSKEENGLTPREFICRCRSYTGDASLNPCAPQKCMTITDTEVLEAIIDKARKEQG